MLDLHFQVLHEEPRKQKPAFRAGCDDNLSVDGYPAGKSAAQIIEWAGDRFMRIRITNRPGVSKPV
ncbi:hypothetical protein [Burkholderia sp. BCC1644]|uniref:hypothetical protein n=1 Tax=Burkholderia sp. BCC1644 TaxID=2676293 RepID=UPI001ABAB8A6|nr:hypothetical protein [Burkholderia sp. BCC1644]